jgi:hypothetical protein
MADNDIKELNDEALLKQAEKMKSTKLYDSTIIGFLVGVAIYSTFANGFGLLTFLPLVYLPIAGKNQKKRSDLKNQLADRGLTEPASVTE